MVPPTPILSFNLLFCHDTLQEYLGSSVPHILPYASLGGYIHPLPLPCQASNWFNSLCIWNFLLLLLCRLPSTKFVPARFWIRHYKRSFMFGGLANWQSACDYNTKFVRQKWEGPGAYLLASRRPIHRCIFFLSYNQFNEKNIAG